jgi:hyperosmotically inducible protein
LPVAVGEKTIVRYDYHRLNECFMQKANMNLISWVYIFCLLAFVLSACSQEHKDVEIKQDLTAKAKKGKEFIGVRFVVNDGIVSLSGECPTENTREKVVTTVKSVYAVKGVLDNIAIAPVTIGTDEQLKESVDSALKTYPAVEAIVKDSIVKLQGNADSKDQQKLLSAIQSLQPKRLESEVAFK